MNNIIDFVREQKLEHEIMRWFERVSSIRIVTADVLVMVSRGLINRFQVRVYATHRYPNWQLINRKSLKTSEAVIEYLTSLERH